MAYEEPRATWEKRYFQTHYVYRDGHAPTALVLPAVTALGMALAGIAAGNTSTTVYYAFGTNARLISKANWPASGDVVSSSPYITAPMSCYARRVTVWCDQNAWIRLVSVNPQYVKLSTLGYSAAKLSAMGVSPIIVETENYVLANSTMPIAFYPAYAVGIIFRADTVQGNMRINIEGNVEGSD